MTRRPLNRQPARNDSGSGGGGGGESPILSHPPLLRTPHSLAQRYYLGLHTEETDRRALCILSWPPMAHGIFIQIKVWIDGRTGCVGRIYARVRDDRKP